MSVRTGLSGSSDGQIRPLKCVTYTPSPFVDEAHPPPEIACACSLESARSHLVAGLFPAGAQNDCRAPLAGPTQAEAASKPPPGPGTLPVSPESAPFISSKGCGIAAAGCTKTTFLQSVMVRREAEARRAGGVLLEGFVDWAIGSAQRGRPCLPKRGAPSGPLGARTTR